MSNKLIRFVEITTITGDVIALQSNRPIGIWTCKRGMKVSFRTDDIGTHSYWAIKVEYKSSTSYNLFDNTDKP